MSDARHSELEMLRDENNRLRQRLALYERDLLGMAFVFPTEWCLTASEQLVLSFLLKRGLATKEQLVVVLHREFAREFPAPNVVESHVCKLRKKMAPHGLIIQSARFLGYSIDEPLRSELRRRVEGGDHVSRAA